MAYYIDNKEKNGLEIYFKNKPGDNVLELLKMYKWRWNHNKSCWFKKYSRENEEFAQAVCEKEQPEEYVMGQADFTEAQEESKAAVKGKSTCKKLKEMRRKFADANGIDFEEEECTYEGPCEGTCAYCDAKTNELIQKAYEMAGVETINYPEVEVKRKDDQHELKQEPELIDQGDVEHLYEGEHSFGLGVVSVMLDELEEDGDMW